MRIIHYMELNEMDVKLAIDVTPAMEGFSCVDYEIDDIFIVNRKHYKLSRYSKMFMDISKLLEEDSYFVESIEQAYMDMENERAIDEAFSSMAVRGVYA